MSDWFPIETAPKDGAWFVTARFHGGEQPEYEVGRYEPLLAKRYEAVEGTSLFRQVEHQLYEWRGFNNFERATHWMPLPPPPESTGGQTLRPPTENG